jgi:hypothetical protein
MRRELEASGHRYIVGDLLLVGIPRSRFHERKPGPADTLPSPLAGKKLPYPWTEPVLFQSGRYVVFLARG